MAIATLEEYLKEFSVEIGDRILTSFPALHAPGDPVSPILGTLLRKPFAAQAVAIAGAVKKLQEANSVAIIAEMGTGKTLMAIAVAEVFSAGRPYACLFCHCDHKLAVWPTYASTLGPVAFTGVYRLSPGLVPDTGGGKTHPVALADGLAQIIESGA